jgi:hypothetical protein
MIANICGDCRGKVLSESQFSQPYSMVPKVDLAEQWVPVHQETCQKSDFISDLLSDCLIA